jgi:hypothetical protein
MEKKETESRVFCEYPSHPIGPKSTTYITTLGNITIDAKSVRKARASGGIDLIDLSQLLEGSCSGKSDEFWLRIDPL